MKQHKRMTILVTGGAGFIASHVADAYINAGHRVIIIDNLNTGFRKNVNPKAIFYKTDIRDLDALEKIFKKERPTIVNHHAAIAEVVKSINNPIPTYDVNVIGTANVLLCFGKYGKGSHRRFIFSSTGGAIYGEPETIPATEETSKSPLSPYGLSKYLGEEVIKFYSKIYGFNYLIFRYPNVYGPRQNPKGEAGVIAIFCGLMLKGERPLIFGDGTKSRDYMFVADIVRANMLALSKSKNEIVNIGWGKEISDQLIFNTLAQVMGFKKPVRYAPYRKGEVYRIALSAQKARRLLGWKPQISLKEGMRQVYESLR